MEKNTKESPLKAKQEASVRTILNAAMQVFAESGFDGARIDEIARRALMNKAMLYYRIGGKKALYEAVIHDVFGDTAQRLQASVKKSHSPKKKFRVLVEALAETLESHPHFSRIMMQEVAGGWTHMGQPLIADLSGILKIIQSILDEGVASGDFIPVPSPVVHMMIIGSLILYDLSLPMKSYFQSVLARETLFAGRDSFDDIVPDIQDLLLRAISPRETDTIE